MMRQLILEYMTPMTVVIGVITVVWFAALIKTGWDRWNSPGGRWRR